MKLKYLHTMVRVDDLDASLYLYCNKLGLREVKRYDYPDNRFTLVMLAAPGDEEALATTIEWLLRHPQEREAFGDAARKRAEMMYDHDQLINRLQEIYETRKVEEE